MIKITVNKRDLFQRNFLSPPADSFSRRSIGLTIYYKVQGACQNDGLLLKK